MKKSLVALGVLFIYGIGSGELLACGDKFLVASRGTRYQRAGQARQSSVDSRLPQRLVHAPESVREGIG